MRKLFESERGSAVLWGVGSAVVAAVGGLVATISPVSTLAIFSILALVLIVRGSARRALVVWLLVACFVPYWVGASIGGYMPVLSLVGLLLLILASTKAGWRLSIVDLLLVVVIAFSAIAVKFANSPQGPWLVMISQWAVPFLLAKVLIRQAGADYLGKTVAAMFGAVGGLAIIERLLNWHPFMNLAVNNGQYTTWSPIQERGGIGRSEWAFGHSLALGGALSLAIPFVMTANIRGRWKFLALVCVLGGTVSTFSRAAMLCVAFTMVLTILFSSKITAGKGFMLLLLLVGGAAALLSALTPVFEAAGFEAESSAGYRQNFITELLGQMLPIGLSPSAEFYDKVIIFGGYNSIDNALLGMGLSFGWVPMALLTIGLLAVVIRVISRRANIAEVALVGQIPMLLAVAFITQYQMLIWFMVGCAVALGGKPGRSTAQAGTAPNHYALAGSGRTHGRGSQGGQHGVAERRRVYPVNEESVWIAGQVRDPR